MRLGDFTNLTQELIKYDGLDVEKMRDVIDGREAINKVVAICNKAAERSHRADEVSDLMQSVDDWKGHRLDHFGDLILSGQHTVLKGDAIKNEEREVSWNFYNFKKGSVSKCCACLCRRREASARNVAGSKFIWPWTSVSEYSYKGSALTNCSVACGALSSLTSVDADSLSAVQDLSIRTDSVVLQGCEPEQG